MPSPPSSSQLPASSSSQEGNQLQYGFGSWRPSCLQIFNKAGWFLFITSLASLLRCIFTDGLIGTSISSIERRYGLSSLESSWIINVHDVATIPSLLLISYLGATRHRPRLISVGVILMGIGSVIFALPHFLGEKYTYQQTTHINVCTSNATGNNDACLEHLTGMDHHQSLMVAFFILSRTCTGIGAMPLAILGITYIDDITSKHVASYYLGIFSAMSILGPAIGFIGGGFLLDLYVDIDRMDSNEVGISKKDPRWVGAWWIGFFISGTLAMIVGVPIFGYPKDLPGAQEIRDAKVSEAHDHMNGSKDDLDDAESEDAQVVKAPVGESLKDWLESLKILIYNPTYISVTLFLAFEMCIITGYGAYAPKYMENQFNLPASLAGALFGALTVPGAAGGTFLGGYLVKRFKMKVPRILVCSIFISTSCLVFGVLAQVIRCQPVDFAGVTVPYNGTAELGSLDSPCNAGCGCSKSEYEPICGADGSFYFSPCYAGCPLQPSNNSDKYYNCSCIAVSEADGAMASKKHCSEPCFKAPYFLFLLFLIMLTMFMCSSMNISTTIRCIPSPQRSIGLSFQWCIMRLIGAIPGPVLFGVLLDFSCMLQMDSCDEKGACLLYDNEKMANYMLIKFTFLKVCSTLSVFMAWKLYRPPKVKEIKSTTSTNGELLPEVEDLISDKTETNLTVKNECAVHDDLLQSEQLCTNEI